MLPKLLMAPSRKLNFIDNNLHLTKYIQNGQNREAVSIKAYGAGYLELVRMRTFIYVNRVGSALYTCVECLNETFYIVVCGHVSVGCVRGLCVHSFIHNAAKSTSGQVCKILQFPFLYI